MNKYISLLITLYLLFIGPVQAANIEAGRAISTACSACHGKTGLSNSEQFPNLAGQKQSYMVKTLQDYRSGARKNLTMQAIVGPLNDQNFEDLSAYFSSQTTVATFSYATGSLFIPYVDVDGAIYKVNMGLLDPDKLIFSVTDVEPQ